MARLFIVIINIIGITLAGILGGGNVLVTMKAPSRVDAGSEFDVEVLLKKAGVDGFARFQQELPLGLTAELIESSLGDFTFEDQKVKVVWLKLPAAKELRFVYRIRVDERLKGSFNLGGFFSYIENNERKTSSVQAAQISITPSTRINPSLIVDINEFQNVIPVQAPVSMLASNVKCIRQTPIPTGEANDLLVKLLVNKGNAQKFAKIEEDIPQGFQAEVVDAKDAIFTFKDQKVKFLWMSMPPDPRFIVSYRLIPINGNGEAVVSLSGKFSYLVGEATRVVDIIQKDVDLGNLDPKSIEGLLASIPGAEIAAPSSSSFSSSFTSAGSDGGIDIPVQYQVIPEKSKKIAQPEQNMMLYMLEPEKGVYYRVQVAAGHKPINIKRYFLRHNVTYEVRTEKHEGWYKYSIGSFKEYKEARDFRVQIWNTTKINDAFVAAYNNGVRITVQEALMITNQTWFR